MIFARGWSPAAAVANAALAVVVLSLALTLAPPPPPTAPTSDLGFTVAGVCVWDGIDGFLRRAAARG